MINWSESGKCQDKRPNGLRCFPWKKICKGLAKKGYCKHKMINLKPEKKCSYLVKKGDRNKRVNEFCKKSCKVCGKHDL